MRETLIRQPWGGVRGREDETVGSATCCGANLPPWSISGHRQGTDGLAEFPDILQLALSPLRLPVRLIFA